MNNVISFRFKKQNTEMSVVESHAKRRRHDVHDTGDVV